jgi:quinoprotein glucose dehydrogenase
VALDASTGAYKWHFQTTRHDILDSDLAAAPALIDVVRNGTRIPAVAQVTKYGGWCSSSTASTGKPIFGVEDRPVPASRVPGEHTAATQPFPIKPAPWARLGMTKADLTTVTPESNAFCTAWWEREQMYNDGPYTPYAFKGVSVSFSGTVGGGNWSGVAFNPPLGLIFVNTTNLGTIGRMVPDPGGEGYRNEFAYTRFWTTSGIRVNSHRGESWSRSTPTRATSRGRFRSASSPSSSRKVFRQPGLPISGCDHDRQRSCLHRRTKDMRFRAYDAKTGKELWYAQLEAAGGATPTTFMGRNGTQYVVIAAGGPGDSDRGGTELFPQKLVAFALTDRGASAQQTPATGAERSTGCRPTTGRIARGGRTGTDADALHGVSRPRHRHGNRPEPRCMDVVVNEMIGLGAPVSDDQAKGDRRLSEPRLSREELGRDPAETRRSLRVCEALRGFVLPVTQVTVSTP